MTPEKRKNFIEKAISFLNEIDTTGKNGEITRTLLEGMSDKDFWEFVKKVNTGEETLALYLPNHEHVLKQPDLIAVSDKHNIPFWQRIVSKDEKTGTSYLSIESHLVLDVPVRRMIQLLDKKMSVPENNKFVDNLTGQPAGPSAAASISFQEVLALYNQGCKEAVILELIKFRGGDIKGFNAMNKSLIETGQVSLEGIYPESGGVKSKQTAAAFLTAQHYSNNL